MKGESKNRPLGLKPALFFEADAALKRRSSTALHAFCECFCEW